MQDTYTVLRHFADSWMLLAMFTFFGAAVLFAFRPGSRRTHDDTADIPFRNDSKPAGAGDSFGTRANMKEAAQ
jgi:cytochrome c oxidase cbb3-type subunit 4